MDKDVSPLCIIPTPPQTHNDCIGEIHEVNTDQLKTIAARQSIKIINLLLSNSRGLGSFLTKRQTCAQVERD